MREQSRTIMRAAATAFEGIIELDYGPRIHAASHQCANRIVRLHSKGMAPSREVGVGTGTVQRVAGAAN